MQLQTGEEVSSVALILIGADTISSFTESTTEAKVANQLYSNTLDSYLAAHPWTFASQMVILGREVDVPLEKWDYSYQMPSPTEVIRTRSVTMADYNEKYERLGDKIFTDQNNYTDDLILHYTERPAINLWPGYFLEALTYKLAMKFATSIARDPDLAVVMESRFEIQSARAKTVDSQGTTSRKMGTSRFLAARL